MNNNFISALLSLGAQAAYGITCPIDRIKDVCEQYNLSNDNYNHILDCYYAIDKAINNR